jgi:lysozyme
MNTSANGIKLIKEHEGCELVAYLCPAGVWTWGYGHTSAAGEPKIHKGFTGTIQRANEVLKRDLVRFESAVNRLVKVPLAQNQFDALVSFMFNIGEGAFERSTLLKKLNRGEYIAVPGELMKWTKAGGKELPGLVRRRRAEAALWRAVDDKAPLAVGESRAKPEPAPPAKSMAKSREGNAAVAVGTAGAITLATEALPAMQGGAGLVQAISDALGRPAAICGVVIVLAAAALWFWRKQRLDEEGA